MNVSNPVIAVVGAGAVGGYYGARLIQHGHDVHRHDVHLLMRSDCAAVRQKGLRIQSCDGDFSLGPEQVRAYDDPRQMPQADLVIVTLKTTANDSLGQLVSPLLGKNTLILTLQNGLGNEELLAKLFGAHRVLGGMAFVCINRLSAGIIAHTDHGLVKIGELTGPPTLRLSGIAELFSSCKITCQTLENLAAGRWEKLVWNVPFNGLGALLDATTDQLIGKPEHLKIVIALMREIIAACRPLGIEFPPSIIDEKIEHTRTMGAYKSSTQIDRQFGRPMEIEAIFGAPMRIAEQHGVPTPMLHSLYHSLKLLDSQRPA